MITLTFLFGALLAFWLDWRAYRAGKSTARKAWRKRFYVLLLADDLLLLLPAVLGKMLPDNNEAWMYFVMWVNWLWLTTVAPRLIYRLLKMWHHRIAGAVLGVAYCLLLVWGITWGRTSIRETHTEVVSAKLPSCFDGLRIVQLTDQHIGTLLHPERELRRIVDRANALKPDLVVLTGDLVTIRYTEFNAQRQAILGELKAPMGVVSVTGNHDVGAYIKDTIALPRAENTRRLLDLQRKLGWRILDNETIYLHRGGDSISLTGLSFDVAQRKERHDGDLPALHLDEAYRDVPTRLFNLTAVHIPQWWDQIRAKGYGDLTLAGHVHSMQCKITVGDFALSPARLLYTRWSGRYDEDGKTLYISDGTGYVGYPVRLGAYPEITLITLKKCE